MAMWRGWPRLSANTLAQNPLGSVIPPLSSAQACGRGGAFGSLCASAGDAAIASRTLTPPAMVARRVFRYSVPGRGFIELPFVVCRVRPRSLSPRRIAVDTIEFFNLWGIRLVARPALVGTAIGRGRARFCGDRAGRCGGDTGHRGAQQGASTDQSREPLLHDEPSIRDFRPPRLKRAARRLAVRQCRRDVTGVSRRSAARRNRTWGAPSWLRE